MENDLFADMGTEVTPSEPYDVVVAVGSDSSIHCTACDLERNGIAVAVDSSDGPSLKILARRSTAEAARRAICMC